MRLFRKVGIQTPVEVNQKNGKGYPFLVCYHFIFLQRIELRVFAITFSTRERPAKQKMIAFRCESKTGLNVQPFEGYVWGH